MKKVMKFMIVIMFVLAIILLIQLKTNKVLAYREGLTYTYGDLNYQWNNDGYFIVSGIANKEIYRLTIPSTLNGYPVKEIKSSAFAYNSNLISVSIPNSIIRIGQHAFAYNEGLENIEIPSSVQIIEGSAFFKCENLKTVKLNEGLENIGANAFALAGLTSIEIPSSVQFIGASAFFKCENLKTVKLNEGLENIGADAFEYTDLTSIEIPSSVQYIGANAFKLSYSYSSNKKTVTLYGEKDSIVENYANQYDYITFIDKNMPFKDVASNSWYYNAVKYVFGKGIMTGFTETEFAPESNLTRAMFITILYKKEGSPYASPVNNFVDLYPGAYYCSAVTWGVNNKIINGYDSAHFGPDDLITREQMAVILQNYCKYKGQEARSTGDLTKFSDYSKVSKYAIYGMKWAVAANVITGSNGRLLPQGKATRAEAAAMMQKYCYSYK